jgi:hypothetical protein
MSLLLAWNFEEASGNVLDRSGNGHDFALSAGTVRTAAGSGYTYGGTVSSSKGLTQSSAAIQLAPITGLNTTSRTVEFWGKQPGANPSWTMEYYRSTEDTGVFGWLMLNGTFRFRAKNSSNAVFEVNLTADAANWHHYAATHDGTSLKAYVDGTQVGSTVSMAFAVSTATDIRVFDNASTAAVIDDVRVYDTVLDAAAITADMNTPVTTPTAAFQGWGIPIG